VSESGVYAGPGLPEHRQFSVYIAVRAVKRCLQGVFMHVSNEFWSILRKILDIPSHMENMILEN